MAGFFSLIYIGCLSVSQEYFAVFALITAFLRLLASFWFIEASVCARLGQGVHGSLPALCVAGCPIQGFIRPKPVSKSLSSAGHLSQAWWRGVRRWKGALCARAVRVCTD